MAPAGRLEGSTIASFSGRSEGREYLTRMNERLAMTAKLAETQLWQHNLASLIRSGLFLEGRDGRVQRSFHGRRDLRGRDVFGPHGQVLRLPACPRRRQSRQSDCQGLSFSRIELDRRRRLDIGPPDPERTATPRRHEPEVAVLCFNREPNRVAARPSPPALPASARLVLIENGIPFLARMRYLGRPAALTCLGLRTETTVSWMR